MSESFTIDGKQYQVSSLPDTARFQLQSIHFIDTEIVRLQNSLAVFQTARQAYIQALKKELGDR